MTMPVERTIFGSFGKLTDQDGDWLVNVTRVQYRIRVDRRDIKLQGTRKTGHKMAGVSGEGSISGFKVSSKFLMIVSQPMRDERAPQFVGQLYVKLADPEAYGTENILLTGVKFWEYAGGFQVDQMVEEEIPFTFYDFVPISTIEPGNGL